MDVTALFDRLAQLDLATWILVGGGIVAVVIAWKVVKGALRLAILAVGLLALTASVPAAPGVDTVVADCVRAQVEADHGAAEKALSRTITVVTVSEDAACTADGGSLSHGTAVAISRTVWGLPMQKWDVEPGRAIPMVTLPDPTTLTGDA